MKEGRRKVAGRGRQMQRNIDVLAEMRKFADHKPVHAVAGIGVLASRTLRELPWRLVHWTRDNPPNSLPGRATGAVQTAQSHATGAVQSVRGKASDGYDTLAAHGKKAMNGQSSTTERKSTAGGQGKPELNGKPKAKAPTRATTGH
jgi:hypothetical protein